MEDKKKENDRELDKTDFGDLLEGEPPDVCGYYLIYRSMPGKRSLRRLAQDKNVAVDFDRLSQFSAEYNWQDRVKTYTKNRSEYMAALNQEYSENMLNNFMSVGNALSEIQKEAVETRDTEKSLDVRTHTEASIILKDFYDTLQPDTTTQTNKPKKKRTPAMIQLFDSEEES